MVNLPKFKNQDLFNLAFIHRSYLNEIGMKGGALSNERLEFLGDSVIAFLTSEFLYEKFPKLPEGKLTSLRSLLVKKDTLAKLAQELNLGRYLKLSRGEETAEGRTNPTLLANCFEAFLGALFIDSGITTTREFLRKTLFPKVNKEISTNALKDSKSFLQEVVQAKKLSTPVYKVMSSVGPDHRKTFIIGVYVEGKLLGKGGGNSKQVAQQQAAKVALEKFAV